VSQIKAAAYYAGIPAKNSNPEKPLILDYFCYGVTACGDIAVPHKGFNTIDCDVALIQGFVHDDGKTLPHLQLRRDAINLQKQKGKRSLIVDSNLFLYVNKKNPLHYLRYSFDGVFPTTANYFWDDPDPSRWQQISRDQNISLKDWRTKGNYILICTQRPGGWSMKGLEVNQWLNQTIAEIRKYSDRPIVVRSLPGAKGSRESVVTNNKSSLYTVSFNKLITQDFINAHAVITYNSSPGVAAAIEGIPVFVTDPNPRISQAYEVSNHSLSLLENPQMPDRQGWIERISMSHWNNEDVLTGQAWRHIKKFI